MMEPEILRMLSDEVGADRVLTDEPMSRHTSFKAGGPAAVYCMPDSEDKLKKVIRLCRRYDVPYYTIGCGSNLLVSDSGYDGVIIEIGRALGHIDTDAASGRIEAGAGAMLGTIAVRARNAGLAGFEFASGIPGSLGGACVMNAGAYGSEMKDVLESVRLIDASGNIINEKTEDLELSYRFSNIPGRGMTVISAVIRLQAGDTEEIGCRMAELNQKRVDRQPLEYPSAGSTFKRPEGHYAGKLIEEAGLKGFMIGDAQVSPKHAGFVINKGNASASDIYRLTDEIIRIVREQSGVELQREIKLLGKWE